MLGFFGNSDAVSISKMGGQLYNATVGTLTCAANIAREHPREFAFLMLFHTIQAAQAYYLLYCQYGDGDKSYYQMMVPQALLPKNLTMWCEANNPQAPADPVTRVDSMYTGELECGCRPLNWPPVQSP